MLALMLALMLAIGSAAAADIGWEKVHPQVVQDLSDRGQAEALIVLREQFSPDAIFGVRGKEARGRATFERLTEVAGRSQRHLLEWLTQRGIRHRSYWIANMIWVEADQETIGQLAARDEVDRIDANPRVRMAVPEPGEFSGVTGIGGPEWGLKMIRADDVWLAGYDGSGIVIAGQDTGYDWDHEALIEKYRGWDGNAAQHDHNWHDAIHVGGGNCPGDSTTPCFDLSHGTHTMGTMVGSSAGNLIGVAPGAKWIGCRNMDSGDGTPASYSECFQFFLAPTDSAGNNPEPALAPHVINNSWGCPPEEGCAFDTLRTVIENVRAAGIIVVASAGNTGSSCESIDDPPSIFDASFTIGATDDEDEIAQFSSRGPITVDGSDRMKPDLSAPGVSVRSSTPDDGYQFFSGTSMAAPHVAGVVALLLEARPDLIGDVEQVEELIRRSAQPLTTTQDCGGIAGDSIPNPIFGTGRIDAYETLFGDADEDGTDNLSDCAPIDSATWNPPAAVSDLSLVQDGATLLTWSAPAATGTGPMNFDLLRSEARDDFSSPICIVSGVSTTQTSDGALPAGGIFYYLVRSANSCGTSLAPPARNDGDCP
jgi:serine protease AprX